MTAHSPGPWRACKEGECSCGQVWSIPGDMPVFYCHNGKRILVGLANDEWGDAPDLIYGGIGREAQKANARLIAAAPDLLAALQLAETLLSGVLPYYARDRDEIIAALPQIRAALNAATGGAERRAEAPPTAASELTVTEREDLK